MLKWRLDAHCPPLWIFIAFSSSLFGWMQALITTLARFQDPAWEMGTVTLWFLVGLGFVGESWIRPRLRLRFPKKLRYLYPLVYAFGLAAASRTSEPTLWAGLLVICSWPLVYSWIRLFPSYALAGRWMFYSLWIGVNLMATLISLGIGLMPEYGHEFLTLAFLPSLVLWAVPKWDSEARPLPGRPGPSLRYFIVAGALAFVIGLAGSTTIRALPHPVPWGLWLGAMLTSLVVALAVTVRVVRTHPPLVLYLSALTLALTLIAGLTANSRALVFWVLLGLLLSAHWLVLWWARINQYLAQHASSAWSLALLPFTIGVGWLTPLVDPDPVTARWSSLLGLTLLLIVIPLPFVSQMATPEPPPPTANRASLEVYFTATHLTPQERRIVQLLLDGYGNEEILKELYISVNTLKTHLRNIYRKTGTQNRRELIALLSGQKTVLPHG